MEIALEIVRAGSVRFLLFTEGSFVMTGVFQGDLYMDKTISTEEVENICLELIEKAGEYEEKSKGKNKTEEKRLLNLAHDCEVKAQALMEYVRTGTVN